MLLRFFLSFFLVYGLWGAENTQSIKDYLAQAYQKHYQPYHIKIKAITLTPPPNIAIKDYQISSYSLDSKYLNKKTGILLLNTIYHNSALKIPLEYQIEASIDVYRATTAIKKSQNIDTTNTTKDQIPLDKITQLPIKDTQIDQISAKSYIPANTIITADKIQAKILIYKNDLFKGIIKDGHINLETTLIAKENGSKNQTIHAINPESKKMIRVKVIDKGKGEVL
ncbi:flagella basal body P-ring formation protein FlgA [Helicobacter sp. 12S02634-8]|uniref:flagellar basal body P-ring formation chaperone FlgA n=1 Tax=Helicobacter sp. 12S02634-8 TaxID=1476199 RepID=UPI000BA579C5|nr:flagellar basal body P-ring formation chaperone FlgA [Helicobacter sp. 12S02634-8]PAF48143.1 flagella basal body P-ring formation protein FlgA [Helicobacter sp. 12S02634-8]